MIHSTELHSKSNKADEYLAGWQRARAELDNFRRRTSDDQVEARHRLQQEVFTSLMSLADNFQAIARHIPDDVKDHSWTEGVLHVSRQLEQLFAEYGVTVIPAQNQVFDPAKHEALEQKKDSSLQSGMVIEVIQDGYQMGECVLRPAKVKVAK